MSFLSVVVATYNRRETLQVTLERLSQQTLERNRYEVIVVDDGSPDDTESMVNQFIASADISIKYLRHQNRGPGYSENRGIREAKGPWILLIADDIHPVPEMLERHYRAHEQNPEPHIAIAGKVVQSPDLPKSVFMKHWDPFRYIALEELEQLSYLNFWACNVSFKKDFMEQYGMFAERAGAAHEDTEVGWRLYKNGGMKLLYCKEALAHHYHPEDIDSACRRAFERGLNFDVLTDSIADEDPGLYIRTHILTRKTLPYFLKGFNDSIGDVLAEDRNVLRFIVREGLRAVLFNRLTIPIYVPMIRRAEHSALLAMLMHRMLIRGTVSYHFLKGLKELRRRRASAPQSMKPLPI